MHMNSFIINLQTTIIKWSSDNVSRNDQLMNIFFAQMKPVPGASSSILLPWKSPRFARSNLINFYSIWWANHHLLARSPPIWPPQQHNSRDHRSRRTNWLPRGNTAAEETKTRPKRTISRTDLIDQVTITLRASLGGDNGCDHRRGP